MPNKKNIHPIRVTRRILPGRSSDHYGNRLPRQNDTLNDRIGEEFYCRRNAPNERKTKEISTERQEAGVLRETDVPP